MQVAFKAVTVVVSLLSVILFSCSLLHKLSCKIHDCSIREYLYILTVLLGSFDPFDA